MALHSLYCADVPLRNCSLTHSRSTNGCGTAEWRGSLPKKYASRCGTLHCITESWKRRLNVNVYKDVCKICYLCYFMYSDSRNWVALINVYSICTL